VDSRRHSPDSYRSYLLRVWRGEAQDQVAWRCSLEDTGTRQCRGFEDVEALASYLRSTFASALDEPQRPRRARKVTSGAAPRDEAPGS
jgi:hypothetical protein